VNLVTEEEASTTDIPLQQEPRKRLNLLQKSWAQTRNDLSAN
jgi:hypothetical protein